MQKYLNYYTFKFIEIIGFNFMVASIKFENHNRLKLIKRKIGDIKYQFIKISIIGCVFYLNLIICNTLKLILIKWLNIIIIDV